MISFLLGLLLLVLASYAVGIVITALIIGCIFIALIPVKLYYRAIRRVNRLVQEDQLPQAYALAHRTYHWITLPILVKQFHNIMDSLYFLLSRLEARQGNSGAAIAWLEKLVALELKPNVRMAALYRMAFLLRRQQRGDETAALETMVRSLQDSESSDSKDASALDMTSLEMRLIQGEFAHALQWLDSFETKAPAHNLLLIQTYKMCALRYLGRIDDALHLFGLFDEKYHYMTNNFLPPGWKNRILQKVMHVAMRKEIHKGYLGGIVMIVALCLEAGRVGAAQEHWQRLSEHRTPPDVYPEYYAVYAWLCAATGDHEQARQLVAQASLRKPGVPLHVPVLFPYDMYAVSMVQTYIALRDYPGATRQLQQLIHDADSALKRAEYESLLGDCYKKMEQVELADAMYEAVIAAGFAEAAFTQHARTQLQQLRYSEQPLPLSAAVNA